MMKHREKIKKRKVRQDKVGFLSMDWMVASLKVYGGAY